MNGNPVSLQRTYESYVKMVGVGGRGVGQRSLPRRTIWCKLCMVVCAEWGVLYVKWCVCVCVRVYEVQCEVLCMPMLSQQ